MDIKNVKLNFDYDRITERSPKAIKRLVIHHTAGSFNDDAISVHTAHLNIGYAGIGYHYIILKDGTIEKGRLNRWIGAHAQGSNFDSLGIAIAGNFETHIPKKEQLEALKWLISELKRAYNIKTVQMHSQINATACPGRHLASWLKENMYIQ